MEAKAGVVSISCFGKLHKLRAENSLGFGESFQWHGGVRSCGLGSKQEMKK